MPTTWSSREKGVPETVIARPPPAANVLATGLLLAVLIVAFYPITLRLSEENGGSSMSGVAKRPFAEDSHEVAGRGFPVR